MEIEILTIFSIEAVTKQKQQQYNTKLNYAEINLYSNIKKIVILHNYDDL